MKESSTYNFRKTNHFISHHSLLLWKRVLFICFLAFTIMIHLVFEGGAQLVTFDSYPDPYDQSKKTEVEKRYYPNGQISLEIWYQNGAKHGVMREYYEDGTVSRETEFQHGKLHGLDRRYSENGILTMETHFRDNMRDGVRKIYWGNGHVRSVSTYREGKLIESQLYDQEGNPDPRKHYSPKNHSDEKAGSGEIQKDDTPSDETAQGETDAFDTDRKMPHTGFGFGRWTPLVIVLMLLIALWAAFVNRSELVRKIILFAIFSLAMVFVVAIFMNRYNRGLKLSAKTRAVARETTMMMAAYRQDNGRFPEDQEAFNDLFWHDLPDDIRIFKYTSNDDRYQAVFLDLTRHVLIFVPPVDGDYERPSDSESAIAELEDDSEKTKAEITSMLEEIKREEMTVSASGIRGTQRMIEGMEAKKFLSKEKGALLGTAVSMCGDYAIVGAPLARVRYPAGDDSDYIIAKKGGGAYILKREGNGWRFEATLTGDMPNNPTYESDWFGNSVAISGNFVIVGAPFDDGAGSAKKKDSGSAFIFRRSTYGWTRDTALFASDVVEESRFGNSVSISGDYAIVGALGPNPKLTQSGSDVFMVDDMEGGAYIFKREEDGWIEQAKIVKGRCESVSIDGDYAIVGMYDRMNGYGVAYIFKRNENRWMKQATLKPPGAKRHEESWERFGHSVSISGNYAIVGNAWDNLGDRQKARCGSAYIYKRVSVQWLQQAKITAGPFGGTLDQFGQSVSICDEYAIVGAPTAQDRDYSGRPTSMARDVGAAYIFRYDGNNWIRQARFLADDSATNDNFGKSVSIANGYAVASAPSVDIPARDSGSVYIFQSKI